MKNQAVTCLKAKITTLKKQKKYAKKSLKVHVPFKSKEVLNRRLAFRPPTNDFVFHIDVAPLNYCTIQINYQGAQRKSGVPYTGTHILRHGMAKLARKVGGGLDAVLAMTGHKDLKLADHYSKSNEDDQKEFSEKIMKHIREQKFKDDAHDDASNDLSNVLNLFGNKTGTNR